MCVTRSPTSLKGTLITTRLAGGRGKEARGAAAGPPSEAGPRLTLREYRDRAERRYIIDVLGGLDWNISRAAVVLGVERTNLHKKIRAYGIKRGEAP